MPVRTFDQLWPDAVATVHIQDNAVTLAKMAHGTPGRFIGFDGGGNPAELAGGGGGDLWSDPVDSDILPTGNDNTYDLGSAGYRFAEGHIRRVFATEVAGAGGVEIVIQTNPGMIGGYVSAGVGYAASLVASALGSFANGHVEALGGYGFIESSGIGSFAQGYANANARNAYVQATSDGSFAQGYAYNSDIFAGNSGSFAQGSAADYSYIIAYGKGSFAQGYANASYISASGYGSFAQGWCKYSCRIEATGWGSFAQGYVKRYGGYYGSIRATNFGSFAQGYVYASSANSYIEATNHGGFAHGFANGYNIRASGYGSFAVGFAVSADIVASATNASQFGPGTNDLNYSLQVGGAGSGGYPVRLCAGGDPGVSVQNGDIWVAGGYVWIRSNGADVQVVACQS